MNKELIKKYKAEFDHWLNGGRLLSKHINNKDWYEATDPSFSNINVSYVIYDEYVELRKALAEGKTVQYRNTNINGFENWEDLNGLSFNPNFEHRVKPDEPQFKVGDWVRDSRDNSLKQVLNPNSPAALSDYIKWKPQLGEWVIPDSGIDKDTFIVMKYNGVSLIPERCQPFIGELPTNLKDN